MLENPQSSQDSAIFAEDTALQETVVPPEVDGAAPEEDFFEPEEALPRKKRGFRIGFSILCVLLLIAVVAALWLYQTALASYEAKQEQPPLQAYLELIKSEDYEALYASSGFQTTELTGKETYIAYLKALYADAGDLSVVKQVTSDSRVQRYHLYNNGTVKLATLLVTGDTDENGKTNWYITAELTYQPDYVVTASEDVDLYVNGQPIGLLSADSVTATEVQSTLFGISDGANLPVVKTYTLTGLLMPPTIEATGINGSDCLREESENGLVLTLADDYERSAHEALACEAIAAQLSADVAASATLTVDNYRRFSESDFSCTVHSATAEGESAVAYDVTFLHASDDTWVLSSLTIDGIKQSLTASSDTP